MNLTWLGASSVLLLLALTMFIAVPRIVRSRSPLASICAEKEAADILAEETESTPAPLTFPAHQTDFAREAAQAPSSQYQPQVLIKRGRVALFGGAVISLAAAAVLALLALISQLSWWLPLALLLVSAFSLATLRILAVRDSKKRGRRRRSREQESPLVLTKAAPAPAEAEQIETVSEAPLQPVRSKVKPLAQPPVELSVAPAQAPTRQAGQAPLSFTAKSLRYARTHRVEHRPNLQGTAGSEELTLREETGEKFIPATSGWQPTEVPQPTYLDVEEVQRELPAPIDTDHYEKSRSKSLAEAQRLGEEEAGFQLDDILARRRA